MALKRVFARDFLYKFILINVVIVCISFFIWGEFGLVKHFYLNREYAQKRQELVVLQQEVARLEEKLAAWQTDLFYVEKMAREELGMAYPNETVYILKS